MGDETEPNYTYNANKPAALFFAVLFGLAFVGHFGQCIHYRTWWIWPLLVGLALEILGFATRYISIVEMYQIWPSVVTQVALIIAPAWMAAANYSMIGRAMSYLGAEYSPMSHHLITKIFVIADFLSIVTQAVGGSMLSSTELSTLKIGFNILIGALAFQVVMFASFVVVTRVFDNRSRAGLGKQRDPVQPLFNAFYISASMIILRSVYRFFEFVTVKFTPTGAFGYTLNHEWLLYMWDALPITIAAAVLILYHPGRFLPSKKGLRLDGTFEDPKPSRVCGCCCIYKRPRPAKLDPTGAPMWQPTQP